MRSASYYSLFSVDEVIGVITLHVQSLQSFPLPDIHA